MEIYVSFSGADITDKSFLCLFVLRRAVCRWCCGEPLRERKRRRENL